MACPGIQLGWDRIPGVSHTSGRNGLRMIVEQHYLDCLAGGFRSSIAVSRMAASGFVDVSDLLGGFGAWEAAQTSEEVSA